jgi:hypothetical protein
MDGGSTATVQCATLIAPYGHDRLIGTLGKLNRDVDLSVSVRSLVPATSAAV